MMVVTKEVLPLKYGRAKYAISKAIEDAQVSPNTISYVETHGTSTPLGDPIEIEGLKWLLSSAYAAVLLLVRLKATWDTLPQQQELQD
jgi:3-oxoacyl-(acyl-carrier-protein) synthase